MKRYIITILVLLLGGCGNEVLPISEPGIISDVSSAGVQVDGDKWYSLCGVSISNAKPIEHAIGQEAAIVKLKGRKAEVFLYAKPGEEEEFLNRTILKNKAGKKNNDTCPNGETL